MASTMERSCERIKEFERGCAGADVSLAEVGAGGGGGGGQPGGVKEPKTWVGGGAPQNTGNAGCLGTKNGGRGNGGVRGVAGEGAPG